ncbi:HEPN domain-containing protein [Candidatus Pacearchaeota archaeon]|nr:HEPN domain-containing protein [Candidatus Pacearchaeota archaeon]
MKTSDIEALIITKQVAKIPIDKQKIEGSIKAANLWLEEAKKNLEAGALRSCMIASYLSMFHSARAILFSDGFRDKTHYGVARYLDMIYAKRGLLEKNWVELLDYYREVRHNNQYWPSMGNNEEETIEAIKTAERFIERMSKLLAKKNEYKN